MATIVCTVCGETCDNKARHAQTCSARCRQKRSRTLRARSAEMKKSVTKGKSKKRKHMFAGVEKAAKLSRSKRR